MCVKIKISRGTWKTGMLIVGHWPQQAQNMCLYRMSVFLNEHWQKVLIIFRTHKRSGSGRTTINQKRGQIKISLGWTGSKMFYLPIQKMQRKVNKTMLLLFFTSCNVRMMVWLCFLFCFWHKEHRIESKTNKNKPSVFLLLSTEVEKFHPENNLPTPHPSVCEKYK